ncbi:hypothetical protein AB0D08_39205 [Kitasatospora sp. NPDC048540]|uniref:hypothetical protein n=1 Tax=unclassified Kitasatospora TaxID=2633591 RepID=UPI00053A5420|nr:hypothetical protein [Kitasatospora sp. MBT63]
MTSNDSGREQLAPEGADALRALAREERGRAEQLAAFLEDVAANGLPDPEDCTPWEELRERHLAELANGQTEQRVA